MIDQEVLIQRSFELEPLSPTVIRLAALIRDPESDLQEVAAVAGRDPALAGSLIRVANSARYGASREIGTVADAVIRVGAGLTLDIATRASVRKTVDRSLSEYGYTEGMFWQHSCGAAIAADSLRRRSQTPLPAEVSTAALLHGIGKLAMAQFLAPELLQLLGRAREGGLSEIEAEREVLGVDHAEVGGLIAQHWQLPDTIRIGVTYQHDPAQDETGIASVVHLANVVAGRAFSVPGQDGAPCPAALQQLGMSADEFEEMAARICHDLEEDPDLFG
ncbi:MAG: HDOD domain-containing protein [Planctomycetota bacterium]